MLEACLECRFFGRAEKNALNAKDESIVARKFQSRFYCIASKIFYCLCYIDCIDLNVFQAVNVDASAVFNTTYIQKNKGYVDFILDKQPCFWHYVPVSGRQKPYKTSSLTTE